MSNKAKIKHKGRAILEGKAPTTVVKSSLTEEVRDLLNETIAGRDFSPLECDYIGAMVIEFYCGCLKDVVLPFLSQHGVSARDFFRLPPELCEIVRRVTLSTFKRVLREKVLPDIMEKVNQSTEGQLKQVVRDIQKTYPVFGYCVAFLQEGKDLTEKEATAILRGRIDESASRELKPLASGGITRGLTTATMMNVKTQGKDFAFNQKGVVARFIEGDHNLWEYTQESKTTRTPYKLVLPNRNCLPTTEKAFSVMEYVQAKLAETYSIRGGLSEPVKMCVDDLVGEGKPFKRKNDAKEAFIAVRNLLAEVQYNQRYEQTDRNGKVVPMTINRTGVRLIEVIHPFRIGYYDEAGNEFENPRAFWDYFTLRLSSDVENPNVLINKIIAIPDRFRIPLSDTNKAIVKTLIDVWTSGNRTKPEAELPADRVLDLFGIDADKVRKFPSRALRDVTEAVKAIRESVDESYFPVLELRVDETRKQPAKRLESLTLVFAVNYNQKKRVF